MSDSSTFFWLLIVGSLIGIFLLPLTSDVCLTEHEQQFGETWGNPAEISDLEQCEKLATINTLFLVPIGIVILWIGIKALPFT